MTASGIELRLLCDVLPVCACSVVLCDLPGLMSPVVVLARLIKRSCFYACSVVLCDLPGLMSPVVVLIV
jgi:hypothetical protein